MATTFNGRRKVRKSFGSIREVTEMPKDPTISRRVSGHQPCEFGNPGDQQAPLMPQLNALPAS